MISIIEINKSKIEMIESEEDISKIIDIMKNSQFQMAGFKKGMLSQFLHCIKPNIFPIKLASGIKIICTRIAPKKEIPNPINLSGVNSIINELMIAQGQVT